MSYYKKQALGIADDYDTLIFNFMYRNLAIPYDIAKHDSDFRKSPWFAFLRYVLHYGKRSHGSLCNLEDNSKLTKVQQKLLKDWLISLKLSDIHSDYHYSDFYHEMVKIKGIKEVEVTKKIKFNTSEFKSNNDTEEKLSYTIDNVTNSYIDPTKDINSKLISQLPDIKPDWSRLSEVKIGERELTNTINNIEKKLTLTTNVEKYLHNTVIVNKRELPCFKNEIVDQLSKLGCEIKKDSIIDITLKMSATERSQSKPAQFENRNRTNLKKYNSESQWRKELGIPINRQMSEFLTNSSQWINQESGQLDLTQIESIKIGQDNNGVFSIHERYIVRDGKLDKIETNNKWAKINAQTVSIKIDNKETKLFLSPNRNVFYLDNVIIGECVSVVKKYKQAVIKQSCSQKFINEKVLKSIKDNLKNYKIGSVITKSHYFDNREYIVIVEVIERVKESIDPKWDHDVLYKVMIDLFGNNDGFKLIDSCAKRIIKECSELIKLGEDIKSVGLSNGKLNFLVNTYNKLGCFDYGDIKISVNTDNIAEVIKYFPKYGNKAMLTESNKVMLPKFIKEDDKKLIILAFSLLQSLPNHIHDQRIIRFNTDSENKLITPKQFWHKITEHYSKVEIIALTKCIINIAKCSL